MNFEACNDVKVDLRNTNAAELKGLVACLNSNGQLQPIKDFVFSVPDEDLEPLISVFNRHVGKPEKRLDLMLDLAGRMREKGLLKNFYSGLDVTTRTHSLQDLLMLFGKAYGRFQKDPSYNAKAKLLRQFSLDLTQSKTSDQVLVAAG